MKPYDSEEPSKYIPMIDRLLAGNSHRRRICAEVSMVIYWQTAEELQQNDPDEISRTPVLEEFFAFTVDGKLIYERLKEIEKADLLLQEEMAKTRSRRLLIETLEGCSSWENQYDFESSEKAEKLGDAIQRLYDQICPAVKCESLNGDETTFEEDEELIDQARSRFESALIDLGFSGVPTPKPSILKRILKAFKS
tara:strand:+ start:2963 stop:3547 length:585 start_codon:yes stop_codon:yes gene_type:complete